MHMTAPTVSESGVFGRWRRWRMLARRRRTDATSTIWCHRRHGRRRCGCCHVPTCYQCLTRLYT